MHIVDDLDERTALHGSAAAASAASPSPAGATLADGTALPTGCEGKAVAGETVAFVADGRAWALDPKDAGHLACLFRVRDPGRSRSGRRGTVCSSRA